MAVIVESLQGGDLNWSLALLRPVAARGAVGIETQYAQAGAPARAFREVVTDSQRDAADQRQAGISVRFYVRWTAERAGIDQSWQLECDGAERLRIVAVKEAGRHRRRWLEWSCAAAQGVRAP